MNGDGMSSPLSVPPAGIEPATRGLGNPASTAMECDAVTNPQVGALGLPQSDHSRRRRWRQPGDNVPERAPMSGGAASP